MLSGASGLVPSDPDVLKAFSLFKNEVTKEATLILADRMPQKILYFNKLVSEKVPDVDATSPTIEVAIAANPWLRFIADKIPPLENSANAVIVSDSSCVSSAAETNLDELSTNPLPAKRPRIEKNGKQRCIYTAAFPPHPQIFRMTEEIKKEVSELIEMAGAVKIFIQLNVPRIEGGNNFGVQIQEEAIQELARVEDAAFSVCSAIVEYFTSRAALVTKIIKYPNVHDYKEALRELDEKKWMLLKVTRIDMRNNYAMLYDLLSKNWEKVVKPRHSDGANMMY